MLDQVDGRVEADGYGARGRSRWIREAYRQMFRTDPELRVTVRGANSFGENDTRVLISGDESFWADLKDGLILHRQRAPLMQSTDSVLIRAAIMFRLRNPDKFS